MKKILLCAAALLATMSVNAQEIGQIKTDDLVSRLGLTTDKDADDKSIKKDVAAGTVFCESENVTMTAAFDDTYSPENAAAPKVDEKNYGTIKIGDLTIDATQAVQGNSNPKDADGANPALASTVPVGGAVFQFDVKKDGYLYVFHKASSNKNYMAYEEKSPMGYIFTMATDGTKALPKVFGYELKGEGEYNYLPDGTAVAWPEKIQLGDDAEDVKQNGLSVIKIPVFEGSTYWVNACGSKMTACGYYFDTDGKATITISNGVSEDLVLLENGQIPGAAPEPSGDGLIWENDGSTGEVSWSGEYRFSNDANKTGEEIAVIADDIWEKMKTTTFYADIKGATPQVRITTGWWDEGSTLSGNDIQPGNELLTDNGDGTWTVKVDLSTNETLLGLVDSHHLLFTGSGYAVQKLYFADATGIQSTKIVETNNGAIYNLAGQKVDASYKGLVIKNGKKYIQK